jgi:hypothetical protein
MSAAALSPARPPSLARYPVGPTCRRRFLHPRASPLSLCLAGPVRQLLSRCPERPSPLSLRRGPSLSDPPSPRPPWTGECALAHGAGFSATTPAHAPSSLLRAPPVPALAPPPHFAQHRPLSCSALAARDPCPRSRPSSSLETAPSLPELRPEVRHLYPCPIFPIALCARPISASPAFGHGGPPCSRGGRPI